MLVESPAVHHELGLTLTHVRALRSELQSPAAQLAPRGVALVEQANSQALCWLRDALADGATWPRRYSSYHERVGRYERAHNTWLRLFQDAGLSPGALELDAVDADTVERFPLLVLSHLEVLDEAEVARLDRYVAAGGRLLCEGQVGWMDSAGRRRDCKSINFSVKII